MKIGVVGGGSWGTALAVHLYRRLDAQVVMWCYEDELVAHINDHHLNHLYLPGTPLPPSLRATRDLEEALYGRDLIVLVPPSHVMRQILMEARMFFPYGVPIVSATKGIENETRMLMSEVLEDTLPDHLHPYFCYLSGPSFAREVAEGKPSAVTIASYNLRLAERVQRHFSNETFRVYSSNDVIGVEVGGALKNVIAIASGAVSALELGHNALAGMITRGLAEMTRLAVRLGANPLTLSGLSGMGDLVLTCTGALSRNRTFGYKLGEGKAVAQILGEMKMVAEGVKTSKSVHDLAADLSIEMPISEEVYQTIYEGKDAKQAVRDIMGRALKREMTGIYG